MPPATATVVRASKRRVKAAKSAKKNGCRDEAEAFIQMKMAVYDKDKNGYLDAKELKSLMADLNDGVPPTDEEVEVVLIQADKDQNGKISIGELKHAIIIWFHSVEEQEGACCIIS